jgi:hypothetical protein
MHLTFYWQHQCQRFFLFFSIDEVESVPPSGTIQEQLRGALPAFFAEIWLGFYNPATELLLQTNIHKISDILCFINGHWETLF